MRLGRLERAVRPRCAPLDARWLVFRAGGGGSASCLVPCGAAGGSNVTRVAERMHAQTCREDACSRKREVSSRWMQFGTRAGQLDHSQS